MQIPAEMILWFITSVAGPAIVAILVKKGWLKPTPPKDGSKPSEPAKPVEPSQPVTPVVPTPSDGDRPVLDLLNKLLNTVLPLLNSFRGENNALRAELENAKAEMEALRIEPTEKKL